MPLPKLLVIDASILFSFFKSDSVRRYIVEELLNRDCNLISSDFVLEELLKNKEKIIKFSGIDELEFVFLFSILERGIKTFSEYKYSKFLSEANKISPHGNQETKDDAYFALALSSNCAIWSDEEAFKQQSKVQIFSTEDLLKELKL